MTRVLVTGGGGFTGRHLLPALRARGWHTISLGHTAPAEADSHLELDITDREGLERAIAAARPEAVVHLAALAHVTTGDALDYYRVNVLGTENLLAALAHLDALPSRVIIASSANVYGANARAVIDESVPPAPVNHYACAKLAMEHMARAWAARLPLIVTRPFNYTGPGQSENFLIPKIVGHFRRREASIALGNLDVSRDFSAIGDVVDAYIALLEAPLDEADSGETLNVCSGRATALTRILELMSDIAGYTIDANVDPVLVRRSEIPLLCGDDSRLRQRIGARRLTPLGTLLGEMYRA